MTLMLWSPVCVPSVGETGETFEMLLGHSCKICIYCQHPYCCTCPEKGSNNVLFKNLKNDFLGHQDYRKNKVCKKYLQGAISSLLVIPFESGRGAFWATYRGHYYIASLSEYFSMSNLRRPQMAIWDG